MYWNKTYPKYRHKHQQRLIVTWDVLKLRGYKLHVWGYRRLIVTWDVLKLFRFCCCRSPWKINSNMRCIETSRMSWLLRHRNWLIVTWDVLKPTTKQQKLILPALINSNMRCIETNWRQRADGAREAINSNMRCIETRPGV